MVRLVDHRWLTSTAIDIVDIRLLFLSFSLSFSASDAADTQMNDLEKE
jgi:hypothetical protein